MSDPSAADVSTIAKIGAAIASFFAGAVALAGFGKKVLDEKADRVALEAVREQQNKHHTAIIELYRKNDGALELMHALDQKQTERHIELLQAIGDLKR